ncbi:MAG: T9SS type A sorting domain-containing protein [Bacteroidetes bacterium]|nr:T9SS type A sorting domain-containing protein [Bacteroidota bacterium]
MKNIRVILFIFLFSNLCFSQTGWYQVNSGTSNLLTSVFFTNLNTGFSTGTGGTLLITRNTGASWQNIDLNNPTFTFKKIYFKDQSTGFILANSPIPDDTLYSKIYKTTNGGNNWFVDNPRINNVFLKNIEFADGVGYMSGGLYSVGPNKFFKSTNDGNSWVEIPTGINGSITSQKFINYEIGYIGVMNCIYKTPNGGNNWNLVYQNLGSYYNVVSDIVFINGVTGFAAGGYYLDTLNKNRFVIKTTNSGANWNYILNDNSATMINSITVVNESVIYASGSVNGAPSSQNRGFIIKTTNGGVTWNNENIPASIPLSDIKNSNLKGFAVGANGVIYKKDNIVAVTQISTTVPSSINLYQNYPNPFNPETTIKFDLTKSGYISLKVYDMTGKEVQNLFNGVKEAGSYQLKFDGASLNSGIYFYKLMTNGTTITKSMVLVK